MLTSDSLNEAEIDEATLQLCKAVASQKVWKLSEDGSLYRVEGDLLISLVVFYYEKNNGLRVSLKYKMFTDDDIFWRIYKVENVDIAKPFMRLCGAFNAPFLSIFDCVVGIKYWSLENLLKQFKPALADIENMVSELIVKIQTEQDHLNMIDKFIEEHFREHPSSTINSPYYMQILSAIRTRQWSIAEDIIKQRFTLGGGSGVPARNGTFYEQAHQYVCSIERTLPEEAPIAIELNLRKQPNFVALEVPVSSISVDTIDDFDETDDSAYWVEFSLMDIKPNRRTDAVEIFGA